MSDWVLFYHVPRFQVWPGSRGNQVGKVHLHLTGPARLLTADASGEGRYSVITRGNGMALCRRAGWYERPPEPAERLSEMRCPRCVEMAEKYRVPWPDEFESGEASVSATERRERLLDWMRRQCYPSGLTARCAAALRIYEPCVNGRYDTALRDLRALERQGKVRRVSTTRPVAFEVVTERGR